MRRVDKSLFQSVGYRDPDGVAKAIADGADVNSLDVDWTPLHKAACRGCAETVRLLIEAGANVDAREKDGLAPLHYAAFNGFAEIILLLVESGANINAGANDSRTPLHLAAWYDFTETAELLIELGADIEARDNKKRTPLHLAAWNESTETMQLLISSGADPTVRDRAGLTPAWHSGRARRLGAFVVAAAGMKPDEIMSELGSFKLVSDAGAAAALLLSSFVPFSPEQRDNLCKRFAAGRSRAVKSTLSVNDILKLPVDPARLVELAAAAGRKIELNAVQTRNLLILAIQAIIENPDKVEPVAVAARKFAFDHDDPAVVDLAGEWNKLVCEERANTVDSVLDMGL